ncbi:MAG: MFS transporter [Rhodospirillaceae bacterium]|nr:MFS transporter [Rhodospirillaceae bacterium]
MRIAGLIAPGRTWQALRVEVALKFDNRRIDGTIDGTWAWAVAGATFVLMFLAYGNAYSFGVFFPAIATEFQANRAETALVFSVVGGLYSTFGVVSGPAADRFGTRPVCLFAMLAMGLGLIYAANADALWQVYLGFGLGLAFGMGFTFAPANAVLQRWFTYRRGLASGFASTGAGISILVLPPLVAVLIEAYDWRTAMRVVGILTLAAGCLTALMMGDPPNTTGRADAIVPSAERFSLKLALISRGFVMLFLSSMFVCIGFFIPFVHLVPYAIDQGLGSGTGVYLLTVIGASSVIGRLLLSAASDRLGRRNSMAMMYLAMAVSFLLWYGGGSIVVLTLFAVLYGVGSGGYVAMIAPIIAEYFGTEKIGSVLGCFMPNIAIGGFFGPFLAGYAFDLWGSYDVPMLVAAACGVAAVAFVMLMPARPYAPSTFQG